MLLAVRVDEVLDGRNAAISLMSSCGGFRLMLCEGDRHRPTSARSWPPPGPATSARSGGWSRPTAARSRSTATACSAPRGRGGPGAGDAAARWRALGLRAPRLGAAWLYRIATNACLDELERRPPARSSAAVSGRARRAGRRAGLRPRGALRAARGDRAGVPDRDPGAARVASGPSWSCATCSAGPAPEVGELLDTTVAAGEQRASARAGDDQARAPALSPAPAAAAERELLQRYINAWGRADVDGLVALLREDVVLRMPPGRAVHGGRESCGSCTLLRGRGHARIRIAPTRANGRPALAMHDGDEPTGSWCWRPTGGDRRARRVHRSRARRRFATRA